VACDPLYALSDAQLRLKHAASQALLRPIAKDSDPATLQAFMPTHLLTTLQIGLIRNMRISDLSLKYF
jgi:hypothetical protein